MPVHRQLCSSRLEGNFASNRRVQPIRQPKSLFALSSTIGARQLLYKFRCSSQTFSSPAPRSKNRIRSTQTERSLPISRLAIVTYALGKVPGHPSFEGIAETRCHRSILQLLLYQFFFIFTTLSPLALLSCRPLGPFTLAEEATWMKK
jgi:hypothetical protein